MMRNYATADGFVTQTSLDHYESIAMGGVGLIIVEATCVEAPRGKSFHYGLVLDDDRFIEGFSRLAEVVHRHGARVAVQLQHGGCAVPMRTTHMQPVGPSSLTLPLYGACRALTVAEIEEITGRFTRAAIRAQKAGLDGVEIHAAHRYLLAQFLSHTLNQRQDQYGGSLENRARFSLEILASTRNAVGPDFPVWARINGQEFGMEKGFTIEEARGFARMLEQTGADAVHVSGMGVGEFFGYHSGTFYDPPGNLVPLAAAVKEVVGIPVIAVGKISLPLAEEILTQGRADLIAMGRNFLVDPEFPNKAREGRFEDIRPCLQCRLCSDAASVDRKGLRCQVNAMVGREREWALAPAVQRKKILVVGGGPAGMEASRVAAWRGHEVLLYEKGPNLGGQMILAAVPPCKTPIRDFITYLETQIRKLGVKIVLGTNVTPSLVETLKPDIVILATGTFSVIPRIPGIDMKQVRSAEEVLQGAPVGVEVVIIGGGLVGCEVADELSERGKKVTIVEVLPEIPKGKAIQVMTRLLKRLENKKVVILTNTQCREITQTGIIYADQEGRRQNLTADSVVLAAGAKPNRDLYVSISGLIPQTYLVGDCVEPGRIMEAVSDGFQIARDL